MVDVFVGRKRKKFVFHKGLLCSKSPYFARMFNGKLLESRTGECYMDKDSVEAFEIFTSYLYSDRFPEDYKTVINTKSRYMPLVDFYILADKLLLAKEVKIEAIDTLVLTRNVAGKVKRVMAAATVNRVLLATAEDCPLRKLVIDIMLRDYLASFVPDENYLVGCLRDVPLLQVMGLFSVLKNPSGFLLSFQDDVCTVLASKDESIKSIARYQTGFLKKKIES